MASELSKYLNEKLDVFFNCETNIMKSPKIIKKEFFKKIVLVQYNSLSNTYKKGFCEKGRKDHIFVSFRMFPFHGNIIFSELSFKRKCKKAASFRKCVFLRKYEIFV